MPGLSVETIVNDGALWGLLAQDGLNTELDARLGADHRFEVDLAASRLVFGGGDAAITAVPHLIASVAPGPRTVRWAWALPDLAGLPSSALSGRLRDFGREQGIATLASEEVPFADFGSVAEDADETVAVSERVGIIASQLIGEVPWFSAPTGESRAVMLLQGGPELPRPQLASLMQVLPAALMSGEVSDPPRALQHLLGRATFWQGEWGASGVRISDGTGNVDVHLDASGQVTEIESSL